VPWGEKKEEIRKEQTRISPKSIFRLRLVGQDPQQRIRGPIRRVLLVPDAPKDNRRVVEVLADQLHLLLLGVLEEGFRVGCQLDQGELGPDDDAPLVAQIVEALIVLVMGQPHGGGANLFDEGQVLSGRKRMVRGLVCAM
jgi:hypothetical protein